MFLLFNCQLLGGIVSPQTPALCCCVHYYIITTALRHRESLFGRCNTGRCKLVWCQVNQMVKGFNTHTNIEHNLASFLFLFCQTSLIYTIKTIKTVSNISIFSYWGNHEGLVFHLCSCAACLMSVMGLVRLHHGWSSPPTFSRESTRMVKETGRCSASHPRTSSQILIS